MGSKYWFNSSKLGQLRKRQHPDRGASATKRIGHEFATMKTGQSADNADEVNRLHMARDSRALSTAIGRRYFVDGSDAYANAGMVIQFEHVPSGKTVAFKAFIMALNESYNSDWAAEQVYGRADPIYMFKNTTRNITMGFKVPAASEGEGFENLAKVQDLVQFLYPNYDFGGRTPSAGHENSLTIAQSPLVRMRVMNLIAGRTHAGRYKKGAAWQKAVDSQGTFDSLKSGEDWLGNEGGTGGTIAQAGAGGGGLLGIIKNLTVNHNLDTPDYGAFELARGTIVPKLLEINFDFGVVHEHHLGWNQEGEFSNPFFPYGVNLDGSGPRTPKSLLDQQISDASSFSEAATAQREQETGAALVDQFAANAAARYSGVFGSMRSKRDMKRGWKTTHGVGGPFIRKIRSPETAAVIAGTYTSTVEGASAESVANDMQSAYIGAGGSDFDISDFIDY